MREIETHLAGIYKLTRLLNMSAESFSESRLKQMCRRVISCRRFSCFNADIRFNAVAHRNAFALGYSAEMENISVRCFACRGYFKACAACADNAAVACLTAALAVKYRSVKNNSGV